MKKILICLILSAFMFIACDKGLPQYNEFLCGTWTFNNDTEYISFTSDDAFIMNDSIQGSYEVEYEGDTEIFYYYMSESGETSGYGFMEIVDRIKHGFVIKNLPMHEGEEIKIYKK